MEGGAVIDLEALIAEAVARELDKRGVKAANDSSYLNAQRKD